MKKENPSEYGKKGFKEMLEPQYEEWYCPNCSTAEKRNTTVNNKTGDRQLICGDCHIVIRFYIVSAAKKTVEEAIKSFKGTPLTKQQKTGSGNKPFKGRKKKK